MVFSSYQTLMAGQNLNFNYRTETIPNYVMVGKASKNDGANIQIYKYEGLDNQKFEVKYNNDGYYTIKAVNSNKVLDVYGRT